MVWTDVEPLEYFAALVADEAQLPLTEAAASLAHVERPELDVESVLLDIDVLARRLRSRVAGDASSLHRLRVLHHCFFSEWGFTGNANDYYCASNAYLDEVLRTRRGQASALAVIYIELAQQIGLKVRPVLLPGHCVVRVSLTGGEVVIDPLTGATLSRDTLEDWLRPYLEIPEAAHVCLSRLLAGASRLDLLAQLLRHLEAAYRSDDDDLHGRRVLQRLMLVLPHEGGERSALPATRIS